MAEVTAAMVKALREQTGAGMMDCKNALTESKGEMEAAVDWLRTKGLAKAAKKAGRVASEGLVGVSSRNTGEGGVGAVVEVNSETDFVARNQEFQAFVGEVAKLALETKGDHPKTGALAFPGKSHTVTDEVTALVARIGENLTFRRAAGLSVAPGVVASYVHNQAAPGLGKIGVLVALKSTGDRAKLEALGRQLAMHVAAANPAALTEAELDPALVERERSVLSEQARQSGKPENVIEKMIEGRMRKYYEEVVLIHQTFVIDGETRISVVLKNAVKDVGAPVEIAGFVRLSLGEGIEKEAVDFAAEVAQTATSR